MTITQKLAELGITLPAVPGPFGTYVPAKRCGSLVYVAGQLPMKDGAMLAEGRVPMACGIEQARACARQCVVNALAAVQTLPGGVDQLAGVLRVGVFVASDPVFHQQPTVANAASELLAEIFGDAGRHVRAAVGVAALPLNAPVEIEFTFTTA